MVGQGVVCAGGDRPGGPYSSDDVPVLGEEISLAGKPRHPITFHGGDVDVGERHLAVLVGDLQLDELTGAVPASAGPAVAEVVAEVGENEAE
jgi:hypothetical protein